MDPQIPLKVPAISIPVSIARGSAGYLVTPEIKNNGGEYYGVGSFCEGVDAKWVHWQGMMGCWVTGGQERSTGGGCAVYGGS